MPSIQCGASIRYPNFERGTAGCLVRFTDTPTRVLLMTAGHVVLPSYARQNDAIYAVDLPSVVLGTLRTWTNFQDDPTADAALIWVDPNLIDPTIVGLCAPTTFNTTPQVGDTLRIFPGPGQSAPRQTSIQKVGNVDMSMPAWNDTINYRNQLLCQPLVTISGDSGAIALDSQNRVVGMVVGGSSDTSQTLVTPIAAILNNSAWNGAQLELLNAIPSGAVAPTFTATLEIPTTPPSTDFASLVQNGFFSNDPNNHSVPRSIRTNNPGALNFTTWQANRAGYVGKTDSDGSVDKNVTTIYRTPEHGVGSWFHLLFNVYSFGTYGPFTITHLAQRYSGRDSGPGVDAYITGWANASSNLLTAATTIDLAIDQQVLNLGRAMFGHEAGRPSPLHDDQVLFAIQQERNGTLPA